MPAVVAGVVAVALVATGAALLVTGGGGRTVVAAPRRAVPTTTTSLSPSTTVGRACRSPLTPEAPLRLWVAGDSLAWSVGTGLGRVAAATGVVAPVYESHVSSGLANPGFYDWPRRLDEELARLDPEVVVVSLGTNDWGAPGIGSATGNPPVTSATWRARYAALVQAVVDRVARPDRTLVWFGPPILKDPVQDAGSRAVAEVVAEVVGRDPDAVFVDGRALLDDTDGSYTPTVEVEGRRVQVRTGDGVHFTPDGADVVGRALFATLDAQCRLKAQAVPGSKQAVVETRGSDAYPGSTGPATTTTAGPAATTVPTTVPTTLPATTTTPTTGPTPVTTVTTRPA